MSKKILSLALAVIMVFSMVTMSSAALATGKIYGVKLSSQQTIVKPGKEVTIAVSLAGANADDLQINGSALTFAYDNTIIHSLTDTDWDSVDSSGFGTTFTLSEKFQATYEAVSSSVDNLPWPPEDTSVPVQDIDKGKNWNDVVQVNMGNTGYTFAETGTYEQVYTINFTVDPNAEPGTEFWIGIPFTSVLGDNSTTFIGSIKNGDGYYGDFYDLSQAVLKFTVAGPVNYNRTNVRWHGPIDTVNGMVDLGMVATFSSDDIPFAFVSGSKTKLENITAVGATIYKTGTETVIADCNKTDVIYKTGTPNEYQFRAVMENVPYTSKASYDIEFYVVTTDKGTFKSARKTIVVADEIQAATERVPALPTK